MRWPILDAVPESQRAEVLANSRERSFDRGEIVFQEGDDGDAMHLVATGRVAVRLTTPAGETATLRVLGPGDYFGELAVISAGPRNATVVALEPTKTLMLRRGQLDSLRTRYPEVDRAFLEAVVHEVRRLSKAVLDAMYVPAPVRLARVLLSLAETYPDTDGTVTISLTQEDLAGLCGTTRPTVNQMLRAFSERGLVMVARGRVEIPDRQALDRWVSAHE